jgi:hypothetical protein
MIDEDDFDDEDDCPCPPLNRVIDLETYVLLRAVQQGLITDRKRCERIKDMAYDELEFSEQTAEHRAKLERLCIEMGML